MLEAKLKYTIRISPQRRDQEVFSRSSLSLMNGGVSLSLTRLFFFSQFQESELEYEKGAAGITTAVARSAEG